MTPLEILGAAISGAPAPRIPVFCNLFEHGARELGMPQKTYYASGEHVAAGQLRMRARYGYDNVWSLFYVGREAELLGCQEILYSEDGPPNVADFVIKDYDDIAKLEVWRAANAQPWLHPEETNFIAVAADQPPPGNLRHLSLDDIEAITAFVLEYAQ